MNCLSKSAIAGAVFIAVATACSDGTQDPGPRPENPMMGATGSISISLTDGPWDDAQSLVLHLTGIEMGHSNGDVIHLDMPGGSVNVDMMHLQNGVAESLVSGMTVPTGQYEWMRLHVDANQSYVDLAGTGGRHGMQMGSDALNGLEVHEPFQIQESVHQEYMLDFDLRRGVQHHQMGMMGDQYDLHSAMRLVNMEHAGGLTGVIDSTMVDVNHPDCDDAVGGNWTYLFPGNATAADDISDTDSDGTPGPIATDRVDMDTGTGDHYYHFGYLPAGFYRLAFTCSGEWDEEGDDDYPSDPEGRFKFQMFSEPIEVLAGQLHRNDLMP